MEDTGPVRKHADVDVIYSDGSRGHVAVDWYESGHVDFNVISGDEGPLATFRLTPGQAVKLSAALVTGPDDLPTSGSQHQATHHDRDSESGTGIVTWVAIHTRAATSLAVYPSA
jgi:hypothetical protein